MLKFLYRVYQFFIYLPFFLANTVICCTIIAWGSQLGDKNFWGYYFGKIWAQNIIRGLFIPVTVTGREHMDPNKKYVIVSNHQGAFDIYLVFGFLGEKFRWMMKKDLMKVPFIGWCCYHSGHIFVDKSGIRGVKETQEHARQVLREGNNVVVFPEGSRSHTGHMQEFARGAFMLADELEMPILPMTINGTFDVQPRSKKYISFVDWHPISITIHEPIPYEGRSREQSRYRMAEAYRRINQGLDPKYQGPDQAPAQ